jgi:CMP-N,N'-diacetyllegionaminic acid synthase
MKYAIIVPARKGSQTLKNKNLINLKKKKLIAYTFATVKNIKLLKFILSDHLKIKKIAKKFGFITDYNRPKLISGPNVSLVKTLLHFLDWSKKKYKIEYFVILQPTSPLRSKRDILKSIEKVEKNKLTSLFSISESLEHPYETVNLLKNQKWNYVLPKAKKFYRRQDFDINSYFINGAIYIVSTKYLSEKRSLISNKHGVYIMPKIRSLDINDFQDLEIVRKILKS